MMDAATIQDLLGESDVCGCEHPFAEHAACAKDPAGPWYIVHHKCRLCCCTLDGGLYAEHGPYSHLGSECDEPEVWEWLERYEILPDAYRYVP